MLRLRSKIMPLWLTGLAVASLATPALAEVRCHVPMAQWQPKEALENKLKAEGWSIERLRTDDGCYKVRAKGPEGKRLKAKFDPATLEQLENSKNDD